MGKNVQGLIAVALDVESITESVEKKGLMTRMYKVKDEWKCGMNRRGREKEERNDDSKPTCPLYLYQISCRSCGGYV